MKTQSATDSVDWKHLDQYEDDWWKQRELLDRSKTSVPASKERLAEQQSLQPSAAEPAWDWHLVAVSAETGSDLQHRRKQLLDYVKAHPDTRLVDLAFSTTTGCDTHGRVREAYLVDSLPDLERQLAQSIEDAKSTGSSSDHVTPQRAQPRAVFYCSGQTNEYAGMGRDLFYQHKGFAERLIAAEAAATQLGLPSFLGIITDPSTDLTKLKPAAVQMALVTLEIVTAQTLISWGISPTISLGHSLGEYASLCVSGVLSLTDTLLLVNHRATETVRLIRPNVHGTLICWMPVLEVMEAWMSLGLSLSVTSINSPSHCSIGGLRTDIETLQSFLQEKGKKIRIFNLKYAFHTAQMTPLMTTVRNFAEKTATFRPPTVCDIASTVTGQIHTCASNPIGPEHIVRQVRDTVDLVGALETVKQTYMDGGDGRDSDLIWIEVGPTPSGVKLIPTNLPMVPKDRLLSAFRPQEQNALTVSHVVKFAYEKGIDIDWCEFHRPQGGSPELLDLTSC